MNWNLLKAEGTLEEIKSQSFQTPVIIYKHSTRCSISSMALNRLERSWNDEEMKGIPVYFLDLIAYRNISNQIESDFRVLHESPQIMIIWQGNAVYDASHMGISYRDLKSNLEGLGVLS